MTHGRSVLIGSGLLGLILLGATAAVMQAAPAHNQARQTPMPAACQQVMDDLETMDTRLEQHVRRMNESQGAERIDAMAAAVNEIAAEHRTMREHMAAMPGCCGMGAGRPQ